MLVGRHVIPNPDLEAIAVFVGTLGGDFFFVSS